MRTTGVLGGIAFSAIVVAAISFAIVDASSTTAELCAEATTPCAGAPLAPYAGWFVALGVIALVAGIVPTVVWLARLLRMPVVEPVAESDDITAA